MSFERWDLIFEGAFISCESLLNEKGVYVIWCKINENWSVLDVGESEKVKDRVCNHDRSDCWKNNCKGIIYYSAHYMQGSTEEERIEVENKIRELTNPPCGEE